MKKFKFSLQSVLDYKSFLEREAKQELLVVNLDIKECEANINGLKYQKSEVIKELDHKIKSVINIETFLKYQGYIDSFDYKILNEENKLQQLLLKKEEKTLKLLQTKKEKEAIEKLKGKKRKAYIDEALKEEQKELDEISSIKKAREICNGK